MELPNSISDTSGQWEDDNERLCAMESCLLLKRFLPLMGIKPRPPDHSKPKHLMFQKYFYNKIYSYYSP